MNDLDKQRLKRINTIVDQVTEGFNNAYDKENYHKLTNRRVEILTRLDNKDLDSVTASNFRIQLQEVEHSIRELETKIDWSSQYDTNCDPKAAKEFLIRYGLMEDNKELIKENEILDKLEKELYTK